MSAKRSHLTTVLLTAVMTITLSTAGAAQAQKPDALASFSDRGTLESPASPTASPSVST